MSGPGQMARVTQLSLGKVMLDELGLPNLRSRRLGADLGIGSEEPKSRRLSGSDQLDMAKRLLDVWRHSR